MNLRLRPFEPDDFEFAYHVGKVALGPYVVAQFGPWDDADHRRQLAERLRVPGRECCIVHEPTPAGDDPVGLATHQWFDDHLALHELYLLPRVHNRGLGSQLVRHFQATAQMRRLPIRLRVLANNPARRLYLRLGFEVAETQPERFILHWRHQP